jgi:hypothetical protein
MAACHPIWTSVHETLGACRETTDRVQHLEAKLARKDSVIAEISTEYVQLKKELGEP